MLKRDKEFQEEAGEEQVSWTRGTADEESGCAQCGARKDRRKTETKMRGLCEDIFGGSGEWE